MFYLIAIAVSAFLSGAALGLLASFFLRDRQGSDKLPACRWPCCIRQAGSLSDCDPDAVRKEVVRVAGAGLELS